MPPVRGPQVDRADSFNEDIERLTKSYPHVDGEVQRLSDALALGYDLPEMPVTPNSHVYAIRLDYTPGGETGVGRFLVMYHATDPVTPVPNQPTRVFTMLSITERDQATPQ